MNILLKATTRIIASIFIMISICCADNKEDKSINGFWTQLGYGRILNITDSTYTYYNETKEYCSPLVSGKLRERFKIIKFKENELILNPGGIVDYHFSRSETLPKIYKEENIRIDQSPENNFEIFWNTFNEHYAFFEKRNINWLKIKEKYHPIVKRIGSNKELYELFIEIIKPFKDGHIKLDVPDSLLIQKNKVDSSGITIKTKGDVKSDIIKKYLDNPKSYNHGVIKWDYIKNSNVGYILVSDMNDFAQYVSSTNLSKKVFQEQYDKKLQSKFPIQQFEDELAGVEFVMNKILSDFADSKAIIIDLRFNGGGYETVALKLLSYFIDEPKHVLSIKVKTGNSFTKEQEYILKPSKNNYDGQVFLLTSKRTASAAEIFALGALAYPKIKTYGSSTNGVFSESLWKSMPNGWKFSLSNELYSDSMGNEYETIGVPVNEDMGYQVESDLFYNSFYKCSNFRDLTIDKILKKE